jgi:hypothetical protein
MAQGRLPERAHVQQSRDPGRSPRWVVAVDESGQPIEPDVLEQRELKRRGPTATVQLVIREPERRAVRSVREQTDRTPRRTLRRELAEHGDVRVVVAEESSVERLERGPRRRRDGARRG